MTSSIFTKSPDLQQGSQFVQLPSELRFQIIRLLLSRPDEGGLYQDSEHIENIRIGSRLGRTCQILHSETCHIFYAETVPSFCISDKEDDKADVQELWVGCSLFSIDCYIRLNLTKPCPLDPDATIADHLEMRRNNHKFTKDARDDTLLMWRKFRKLRFLIGPNRTQLSVRLGLVARLFAQILNGKDLEIVLDRWATKKPMQEWLVYSCRILTCTAITYSDGSPPVRALKCAGTTEGIQDTYRDLCAILKAMVPVLPRRQDHGEPTFEQSRLDGLLRCRDAALLYERHNFHKILSWICQSVVEWKREWFAEELRKSDGGHRDERMTRLREVICKVAHAVDSCRNTLGDALTDSFMTALTDDSSNVYDDET